MYQYQQPTRVGLEEDLVAKALLLNANYLVSRKNLILWFRNDDDAKTEA